jgi:hypothetical protein
MPIPDYQSLMLPILNVSANGETRIGDAIAGTPVEKPPAPFSSFSSFWGYKRNTVTILYFQLVRSTNKRNIVIGMLRLDFD